MMETMTTTPRMAKRLDVPEQVHREAGLVDIARAGVPQLVGTAARRFLPQVLLLPLSSLATWRTSSKGRRQLAALRVSQYTNGLRTGHEKRTAVAGLRTVSPVVYPLRSPASPVPRARHPGRPRARDSRAVDHRLLVALAADHHDVSGPGAARGRRRWLRAGLRLRRSPAHASSRRPRRAARSRARWRPGLRCAGLRW